MVSEIRAKYEEVFDKQGDVKNCGREKCKELIELCEEFTKGITGVEMDYGNKQTGMMNVEGIKNLIKYIG